MSRVCLFQQVPVLLHGCDDPYAGNMLSTITSKPLFMFDGSYSKVVHFSSGLGDGHASALLSPQSKQGPCLPQIFPDRDSFPLSFTVLWFQRSGGASSHSLSLLCFQRVSRASSILTLPNHSDPDLPLESTTGPHAGFQALKGTLSSLRGS